VHSAGYHEGIASMFEYFSKMQNLADEMVSSGQPLNDEEFVAYVLTGLDEEIYTNLSD
jgi:polyhydroxyalkanoate synthesis regulator phasin